MAKELGLVFDLRRCIGCETCVLACKLEHNLGAGARWMRVDINAEPEAEGSRAAEGRNGAFRPVACMHCQAAPCIKSCVFSAITRREDGIVLLDTRQCTGCQVCLSVCPYDAIYFDPDQQLASKCDLCSERIDRGQQPFCARECPTLALHFGDLRDAGSEAAKLVTRRKGYALKPEKGTRPANRYLD